MTRINRKIVIFVCLISYGLLIAGSFLGPKAKAQARRADLTKASYRNSAISTILIEAFVVQVKLSALEDLGVSQIGEKPNSVTIENILACLEDKDSAQVGSGVKVAARQGDKGHVELEETIYIAQERPIKIDGGAKQAVSKNFHPYQVGKYFEATVNTISNDIISVKFDFRQEEVQKISSEDKAPPNVIKRFWDGTAYVERGKASIVGATQDDENGIFLILCADIRGI